jgi:phage host-nuclease inhibitor protein Gam
MTDQSDIPADKLTKAYIKLRAKRAEISAKYKEEDGALVHQQEILKNALLDYCENHHVESVRTSEGLFFRSTKTKYWTSDWEQMYSFIKEHDVPEFLDKRLNQTNVKQFLEENPDVLPKGMNVDTEYVISVRKK